MRTPNPGAPGKVGWLGRAPRPAPRTSLPQRALSLRPLCYSLGHGLPRGPRSQRPEETPPHSRPQAFPPEPREGEATWTDPGSLRRRTATWGLLFLRGKTKTKIKKAVRLPPRAQRRDPRSEPEPPAPFGRRVRPCRPAPARPSSSAPLQPLVAPAHPRVKQRGGPGEGRDPAPTRLRPLVPPPLEPQLGPPSFCRG